MKNRSAHTMNNMNQNNIGYFWRPAGADFAPEILKNTANVYAFSGTGMKLNRNSHLLGSKSRITSS